MRAINRLFSHQTYPIGLVTGEVKNDGVTYNEFNFPLHDIFHAHEAFLMIESSLPSHEVSAEEKFTRTFYEQFNYDKIMNTLPERDKLLFDFGYFLYFHESIGNTEWGFQVSALLISQKITIKSLQRSYGQFFFRMEDFVYNFSSNNRVTVRYNRKKGSPEGFGPRNTISRLLNKDDMWDQLPIEIKKKINDSPDKAEEIAAGFAEEFFTLFFQIHYSLAVKILEIP